jgi:hypothetical protein
MHWVPASAHGLLPVQHGPSFLPHGVQIDVDVVVLVPVLQARS